MIYVVNAIDTSDERWSTEYSSWIDFWEKKTRKKASFCRHCGKITNELCGGHVQIVEKHSDNKWHRTSKKFIVPLCSKCNNSENNTIFKVDENDLVAV